MTLFHIRDIPKNNNKKVINRINSLNLQLKKSFAFLQTGTFNEWEMFWIVIIQCLETRNTTHCSTMYRTTTRTNNCLLQNIYNSIVDKTDTHKAVNTYQYEKKPCTV